MLKPFLFLLFLIKKNYLGVNLAYFIDRLVETASETTNRKTSATAARDDDDESSDLEENTDGDATAQKERERQDQELDYVGEEEEQDEMKVDNQLAGIVTLKKYTPSQVYSLELLQKDTTGLLL